MGWAQPLEWGGPLSSTYAWLLNITCWPSARQRMAKNKAHSLPAREAVPRQKDGEHRGSQRDRETEAGSGLVGGPL